MRSDSITRFALPALLLAASAVCSAQAVPAGIATAPSDPFLPPLDGVLHYALSASELVQLGYYTPGQTTETTVLSGDIAYQGKSQSLPFSMLFAAGVLLPNQAGIGASGFISTSVTQGLVTHNYILNVSDTFSFLPQSPTTGLSGVAGVGDLGLIPVQGPTYGPAGGVLSTSGNMVANTLSGSAERVLTRATSISGLGSWSILHFLDNTNNGLGGIDYSQKTGEVSLNQRINARSSASVSAVYSVFDFSGGGQAAQLYPNFQTKGLNFSYQRTLSRTLTAGVTVGPQWVSSSDSALIPNTVNLALSADLAYVRRTTNASVFYTRGVNGGSGVIPGALSDSFSAAVGRAYGRNWVASLSGSYVRTSGLSQFAGTGSVPTNVVFNTDFIGGQVTRRISNTFSAYGSYTFQNQSFSNSFLTQNAFNGTSQTFGIGITYTPRSTRLGQF